jgi:hypothetical protein
MSRMFRHGLASSELGMLPFSVLHPLHHSPARSEDDEVPMLQHGDRHGGRRA